MRLAVFFFTALAFAQPPKPVPPVVPDDVALDFDVEYSRVGERVALDIFRPKTGGPHPAVLAIHGGGFRAGSRASYHRLCIQLAQKGFVAATASYRLAPRHQFPAAVEDVKAAVRFLRANARKYNLDPDHIGATGGSAGGHLALMLGLTGEMTAFDGTGPHLDQSSKVQAVVNFYGPTDFTKSYEASVDAKDVLPQWIGNDLAHNRKQHLVASPLFYVTPLAPPTLTVHGTKDTYVAYDQGRWLDERMKAAGAVHELETIVDAGHGFKGQDLARAEGRLLAWFEKYLRPAPQRKILISDHGLKGEVVLMDWPSGKEHFRVPNGRGHDAQPLPGGNILYTVAPDKKVYEVDPFGKRVWECCDGLEHPLAAQRLPNGNTIIGDAKAGRVMEVNQAGQRVWNYTSDDLANMRMRNVRRTAAGSTLICVEAVAKVIEISKDGQQIWEWQAPEKDKRRLYQALRLPDGNTILSLSDPGEVVIVNPQGAVVRSIGGAKSDIKMGWASGIALFPNGNLLISDYTGRRLLEVDPAGAMVNELRLGPRTVASLALVE